MDSSNATLPISNGPSGEPYGGLTHDSIAPSFAEFESAGRIAFSVEKTTQQDGTASSKNSEPDSRREEAPVMAGFDTLRFKNNFLEVQYFKVHCCHEHEIVFSMHRWLKNYGYYG